MAKGWHWASSLTELHLSEIGSFIKCKVDLVKVAGQWATGTFLSLTSNPALRLQTLPSFYRNTGDPNSGPCTGGKLQTQASIHPSEKIHLKITIENWRNSENDDHQNWESPDAFKPRCPVKDKVPVCEWTNTSPCISRRIKACDWTGSLMPPSTSLPAGIKVPTLSDM